MVKIIAKEKIDEKEPLFVRIPMDNIKFEDSYEQYKFEQMSLATPNKATNYLEQILHDLVISVSFNQGD